MVTGLIAGTGLTGGGVGGNLALNVDPTVVPLLYSPDNNFTGNMNVTGILTGGDSEHLGSFCRPVTWADYYAGRRHPGGR